MKNQTIIKNQPIEELRDFVRKACGEGIVLLENKEDILPLRNKKINVFGRTQIDYYKSGTGSGGLVNVSKVTSIIEGMLENPLLEVNSDLWKIYQNWIADNPFNSGNGYWASEPWSQIEMPLTDEIVTKARAFSDIAIVVIGRTAGEDKDNQLEEGSYLLKKDELAMLDRISAQFEKIILLLNVGNPIDLTFVNEYPIKGLLFVWHGGMEGARAVSDCLTGLTNPSGKLTSTIVKDLRETIFYKNFGNKTENYYQEDIYVGYRYYLTFQEHNILYPFGYGLSYSQFKIDLENVQEKDFIFTFKIKVKNQGNFSGKEVVQIYLSAPQGKLGKPIRELGGFIKTKLLKPEEEQILLLKIDLKTLASFDDHNATGYINSFVLEEGIYHIYLGNSSLDLKEVHRFVLNELYVVQKLREACAPVKPFLHLKPKKVGEKFVEEFIPAFTKTLQLEERRRENLMEEIPESRENKSILKDVYDQKISLDKFIGQLSVEELAQLSRGEGMSSPKVTSGCASCFGGVTDELLKYEIPLVCCADGPSGIRMDSGQYASSLPNGTLLACTMNYDLVRDLYSLVGEEMRAYNIDCLLGPGMNIQRYPLNGRNFEYFSEDPLLTGMMGSAVIEGLKESGVEGTLKHFACNNQEAYRTEVDSILSQRALREIYLRGFEIVCKSVQPKSIMTAYNPINGIWAASNYDLNTTILREEWKFKGIVMTDWWAKMNDENKLATRENTKAMIISQNDLYMVVSDSKRNSGNDNTLEAYEKKELFKAELQRNARNILQFILNSYAFKRIHEIESESDYIPVNDWFKFRGQETAILDDFTPEIWINRKKIEFFNVSVHKYILTEPIEEFYVDSAFSIDFYYNSNCAIIQNQEELYYFVHKNEKITERKLFNFDKVNRNNLLQTKLSFFDPIDLGEEQISYKSEGLNIEQQTIIAQKNEYVCFLIDFKKTNKYLITLDLLCDASEVSQVPFSFYIGEVNKSTITATNSKDQFRGISTMFNVEQGEHILTVYFNSAGIRIKNLQIKMHG